MSPIIAVFPLPSISVFPLPAGVGDGELLGVDAPDGDEEGVVAPAELWEGAAPEADGEGEPAGEDDDTGAVLLELGPALELEPPLPAATTTPP